MAEEWGPWIEHDGKDYPSIPDGVWIRVVGFDYDGTPHDAEGVHKAEYNKLPQWIWAIHIDPDVGRITRYRIRKPKGMTILEGLLEDLPQDVSADEWTRV